MVGRQRNRLGWVSFLPEALRRVRGAPKPGQDVRVVLPKVQQPLGHPHHPVQVERADAIGGGTFDEQTLVCLIGGIAQLAGSDLQALQAEAVLRRRWRGQQAKPVFRRLAKVVLSDDDAGARRGRASRCAAALFPRRSLAQPPFVYPHPY